MYRSIEYYVNYECYIKTHENRKFLSWAQWYTPIIPAAPEAEVG
jgi:hypothetical protein